MKKQNYASLMRHIKHLVDIDQRGSLAEIKKGASAATRSYAWPHIAPYCNLANKQEEIIVSSVAAMFVLGGGKTYDVGNFGASMNAYLTGGAFSGPCDSRMKRFLSARTGDELCQVIIPTIRMLIHGGAKINYQTLMEDMVNWDDQVKRNWARTYYTTGA